MYPVNQLVEPAIGVELPLEVYTGPDFLDLYKQSAIAVTIVNDLVGMAKDIANGRQTSSLTSGTSS